MSTPDRVCATCGQPLPCGHSKYCSIACYRLAVPTLRRRTTCANCGTAFYGHIRSTLCSACAPGAILDRIRARNRITQKQYHLAQRRPPAQEP